jgi:DNA polymerase III epsilon subunit-like protein
MAAPKNEPKIYTGIGLDFETSGLDCIKHACTQLAMQAIRFDTWKIFDRYVKYFQPYQKQDIGGVPKRKMLRTKQELLQEEAKLMEYQPEALTYSGITMDTLYNQGADLKLIARDVIDFGKRATLTNGRQTKPILIGQNITFDIGFLEQLMCYAGLMKEFEKVFAGHYDFYGNFQPKYLDTIDLGRLAFANDPTMTSYKLELIAERLGLELDDAHDAGADVTATLNVAIVCSNRLRNNSGVGANLQTTEKTRLHFKI